ncbi:MAG: cell filamentation protein Fic, partial [Flavobacteriaceae bacterium CG02_land_8_20_14_3_00_34_13]
LYSTPEGEVKLNVLLQDETIWLTQKTMGILFDTTPQNITIHLKNIFESGELEEGATCKEFLQVQMEGGREVSRKQKMYNLDVIISVGYRVNSAKATQFRIWATKTLKEYIIKGFVLDDNRLKQGETVFGKDYFKELLERVRSIRASERRIYQQITDIFAECSIDYDPKAEITKNFYAMVQNKFHFAITGQTAAEIIFKNANAKKENMGLTTWKNAPKGRIVKTDTTIAKNYLQEKEIKQLERTVTGYFDYIENLIERENTFTMEGLAKSVDKFLNFNEFKILEGKGTKSHGQAISKAGKEYDQFNKTQKIISDFDKQIKKLKD